MNVLEVDTAVIGAGIIGSAIAERLCSDGHDVTLIDRQSPGEGCSKGNAGHFATDIVLPLANVDTLLALPRMLMDSTGPLSLRWSYLPKMLPWLSRFVLSALPANSQAAAQALRELNSRSIESYEQLFRRLRLNDMMVKRGALTIYRTQQGQQSHYSTVQLLREYGVQVEGLSAMAVRELEPFICEDIAGGLFFPDTAHSMNPYRLVQTLVSCFAKQGGNVIKEDIRHLKATSEGRVSLVSPSSEIRAKRLVIAAGAWSKPLAEMLGYSVPLETERGYHLMLPEPQVEPTRPITVHENSFVMTPMEEGLRLAGTVELAGLDAPADYRRADILFDHASSVLPGLDSAHATRWMGFRPSLPDSLPVIGASPMHPNVYFAFGHQHLGLTQAAVTADIISDLLAGRGSEIDTKPYSIDRFRHFF